MLYTLVANFHGEVNCEDTALLLCTVIQDRKDLPEQFRQDLTSYIEAILSEPCLVVKFRDEKIPDLNIHFNEKLKKFFAGPEAALPEQAELKAMLANELFKLGDKLHEFGHEPMPVRGDYSRGRALQVPQSFVSAHADVVSKAWTDALNQCLAALTQTVRGTFERTRSIRFFEGIEKFHLEHTEDNVFLTMPLFRIIHDRLEDLAWNERV